MKLPWPFRQEPAETAAPEAALPLDQQGIPILNEVVEPTELGLIDSADPNQASLPLFEADQDDNPATPATDPEALRETLRAELLQTVEQVADTLTERFRADLEGTLREEIDRVLDERLPPAHPGTQESVSE